jgi:tetratricopeptide (TPR) repeat protein
MALVEERRLDEATAYFDRLIARDSKCADAWFFKGMTLLYREKWVDALACFDTALAIDSAFCEAYVGKASAFHKGALADREEMERYLQEARQCHERTQHR